MRLASPRAGCFPLGALLLVGLFASGSARSEGDQERRTRAGARFFRHLLAADLDLKAKADDEGRLVVLVYVSGRPESGNAAAERIRAEGGPAIQGQPIVVETTNDASLEGFAHRRLAGVFLADAPATADLDRMVRWSVERRVLVFSPFVGHVERGIPAGLLVEAQVQPFLNLRTLRASGISLKPLFLKVSKVLE